MRSISLVIGVWASCCALMWAQDAKQQLQQRLDEVTRSVAEDQVLLNSYKRVETTEVSLKSEVKEREQKECLYGPDGKMLKTPLTAPAEPKKQRGLKGKVMPCGGAAL
jgi:hypothetical protein